MITVRGAGIRVGARLLLSGLDFHVSPGDRIGLVGRNGAGKTTLMATLAGLLQPAEGSVVATTDVGYLPQDPKAADPAQSVTDRILSARGMDTAVRAMRRAERDMDMGAYVRAEAAFQAAGGYAAEAEAARVADGVGLP
ncbi:MAG: ABC-F family ATP-binding cassette domain-containing protein, partial [Thermoactinospora sp.]|nr:ABC-F family ATP-binding cassette domain-containing protein [Thermoactinospora sp.]